MWLRVICQLNVRLPRNRNLVHAWADILDGHGWHPFHDQRQITNGKQSRPTSDGKNVPKPVQCFCPKSILLTVGAAIQNDRASANWL